MRYRTLDIFDIDPDPKNARTRFKGIAALANSIEENGLLTSPVVRRKADGRWELIAGERRQRALHLLVKRGRTEFRMVRCQVRSQRETSNDKGTSAALAENLCRADLHPLEAAIGLADLLNQRGWNPKRVQKSIGRSPGWISAHRTIATNLHEDLRSEVLSCQEPHPWRDLYEAARLLDADGYPDYERQRARLFATDGAEQRPKRVRVNAASVKAKFQQLEKSRRFPASVKKHLPEILAFILGEQTT